MKGLILYKMTGSGNDFLFADGRLMPGSTWTGDVIRNLCRPHTGVGADGFAVLEPGSRAGGVRFHFFNSDGSRASMCGNAALCATRLAAWLRIAPAEQLWLETDAGVLEGRCLDGPGERAEVAAPPPGSIIAPDILLEPGERSIHFTDVGVPHLVVLVDDVAAVEVCRRGRELRSHETVQPHGANVNFVSCNGDIWFIRTFERGVEGETLACGTGTVAAAAVLAPNGSAKLPWSVKTASGAVLRVSGRMGREGRLESPRLDGEGRLVFRAIVDV